MKPAKIFTYTDSTAIHQVVQSLLSGRWRIPEFQRDYCWTMQNVEDLIDSCTKKWPLGNAFLVDTNDTLKSVPVKRKFTNVSLSEYGYSLVLDGAQRLETLFKLFVTEEFCWLQDLRKEEKGHFVLPQKEALEICSQDPYIFNLSRHNAAYFRSPKFVIPSLLPEDLSKIPKEHLTEYYGDYEEAFIQRLFLHRANDEQKVLISAYLAIPPAPVAPSPVPRFGSKEAKGMTREEHAALKKAYVKANHLFHEEIALHQNCYGALSSSYGILRSDLMDDLRERIDELGGSDMAYLGATTLRTHRDAKLSLDDLTAFFKRYNMAGVPVDISFLESLKESV